MVAAGTWWEGVSTQNDGQSSQVKKRKSFISGVGSTVNQGGMDGRTSRGGGDDQKKNSLGVTEYDDGETDCIAAVN